MGLDMYLTAERYMWSMSEEDKARADKIAELFPELKGAEIKQIEARVGYWRKANAIHQWFVDKCQDGVDECQKTWVGREALQDLLDTVNKVLADRQLAAELLPSASGFFFGRTDYDDRYYQVLEDTKQICEAALELIGTQSGWDIHYQSSW